VEPENDQSNNFFSDDWREGVLGQIPYLNTAIPFGTLELSRERESKGILAPNVGHFIFLKEFYQGPQSRYLRYRSGYT